MSQGVEVVGLYVRDQDEALAFYVEKVGFKVHTDVRNGDYRWLTVQHPEQPSLQLGLFAPGPPVLDALSAIENSRAAADVFVLELSSFQLESTSSLEPDAGAMLNLCEDHMDRYDSLKDYAAAKARIFHGAGVQVLNRDDGHSMSMALPGRVVKTFGLGMPRSDDEWGLAGTNEGKTLVNGTRRLLPVRMPSSTTHCPGAPG